MEKKIPHIYRKDKGQIVIQGKVQLTDAEGNKILIEKSCIFMVVPNPKLPFCDGSINWISLDGIEFAYLLL